MKGLIALALIAQVAAVIRAASDKVPLDDKIVIGLFVVNILALLVAL